MACLLPGLSPGEATIGWKADTRVLIQPGGQYARIARLDRGTLLCVFSWQRGLHLRRSYDEGRNWDAPVKITAWAPGNVANAEVLVLKNGGILAFYNLRPGRGSGTKEPHSIGCCRSGDGGRIWSEPIVIYGGDAEHDKGCWEPAALELPDGKIAVWFANENPFPASSHDQEISLCLSSDRGLTWSAPRRFSYRPGSRDGMPVPALSADGRTVNVAIEDNGLSGTFKPVILTAPVAGLATAAPIDARSAHRAGALAAPLPAPAYAGAPYLRMMPPLSSAAGAAAPGDGRTVLSFQFSPSGDMQRSTMAVCLGNAKAGKFGPLSQPFAPAGGVGDQGSAPAAPAQLWNSLFIKDAKTITAVSETTLDGKQGIWAIDGEVRDKP